MDEQLLLDEQLFSSVPENLDTVHVSPDVHDESDSSFEGSVAETGLITRDDQEAASVMNSLSLGKPSASTSKRHGKETISIDSSASSLEPETTASSEPFTTNTRKRKVSDSPVPTKNPKRIFPDTNRESQRTEPARSKLATGRLNRPTRNPLNTKYRLASRQTVDHDKFAIVLDAGEQEAPTKTSKQGTQDAVERRGLRKASVDQQELQSKSHKPNHEGKRRRGRPTKAETTSISIQKAQTKKSIAETVARVVPPSSRQSARQRGIEPKVRESADVVAKDAISSKRIVSPLVRGGPQKKAKPRRSPPIAANHSFVVPSIEKNGQQRQSPSPPSVQREDIALRSQSDEEGGASAVSRGSSGANQSNKARLAYAATRPQPVKTRPIRADKPLLGPRTVPEMVGASQDGGVDVEHGLSDNHLDEQDAEQSENESDGSQDVVSDFEPAEEDVQGSTAKGSKGPEEAVADPDEEDIPNISEDDGLVEDLELFGGRDLWERALEGAMTVGASTVKGEEIRRRPKIATVTGKDFVELVNGAQLIYEQLAFDELAVADEGDVEQRLHSCQEDIDEFVDSLSEDKASVNKRAESLLVQDIYAHAIPAMVFLLRAALFCRSVRYSDPEDVESLAEIVHIQATIVRLCEKARRWGAEPPTKRPIKNAVAGKILPATRDLKLKFFGRELGQRRERAKTRAIYQSLLESHRRKRERDMQATLDFIQRKKDNLNSWSEKHRQLEVRPNVVNRQSQRVNRPFELHQRRQHTTTDQWTEEQNKALVNELLSERTCHLPGKP